MARQRLSGKLHEPKGLGDGSPLHVLGLVFESLSKENTVPGEELSDSVSLKLALLEKVDCLSRRQGVPTSG